MYQPNIEEMMQDALKDADIPAGRHGGTPQFIHDFLNFMHLEKILMDKKKKSCKYGSDDYAAETYWTALAIRMMHESNEIRKENLRLLKEHNSHVDWAAVCSSKEYGHCSRVNQEFLDEFYGFIDWVALFQERECLLDDGLVGFAVSHMAASWDEISAIPGLPEEFLVRHADDIQWDIYVRTHPLESIPAGLRDMDAVQAAMEGNAGSSNSKCIPAGMGTKLRERTWVDRIPGSEANYQDDTGIWIDTGSSDAEDESMVGAVLPDGGEGTYSIQDEVFIGGGDRMPEDWDDFQL